MSAQSEQSELDKVRAAMRAKKGKFVADAAEFKPEKAKAGETLQWTFFILPPTDNMYLWFYSHGYHYINNKRLECPRLHDGEVCDICQYGFSLMSETDVKEERSKIAKNLLPQQKYAVNIYFPAIDANPTELRDKVMWFSLTKTLYEMCESVIGRDDAGNGMEPEPFGIFYDVNNAYPFILKATKKGDWNDFSTSKFINKPQPITKKGEDKINEILSGRHDIPSKFAARDMAAINEIAEKLNGGIMNMNELNKANNKDSKDDKAEDKASTKTAPTPPKTVQKPVENLEESVTRPVSKSAAVDTEEIELDVPFEKPKVASVPDNDPELDKLLSEIDDI